MRPLHALLLFLLLLGGCRGTRPPGPIENPGDPDAALRALLPELRGLRAPNQGGETGLGEDERSVRMAEALRRLRQLELRHPRHAPTLTTAAAVAAEQGDRDRAIALLDQVAAGQPGFVPAALLRASIAAEEGNLGLARRRLEEALLEHPDDPRLHQSLAGVLHLSGDGALARSELSLARQLWGEDAPPGQHEYHLGLIAESEGRPEEAVLHYRAGLLEAPEDRQMAARLRALEAR